MNVTETNVTTEYEKHTRHVLKLGGVVGITIPSTIAKRLDLKPNKEVSVICKSTEKQAIVLLTKIDFEEQVISARSEHLEASE